MNRRILATLAKAAVSVLLIWFLVDRIDLNEIQSRLANLSAGGAVLSLAIMVGQAVAATLRWRLISRTIGIVLQFGRALHIVFIGLFFNQTLPSSIGGDAMRVWMVMQQGTRLGKAINTVLSDRVMALLVLIGLMGATLPMLFARIADPGIHTGMSILVTIGAVGMAVFLLAGERIAALLRRWRITGPLGELAADFRSLFRKPPVAAQLCFWSLTIHLLTIATVYILGRSLNVELAFVDSLIVVPVVVLATTLPISVAGWGVREGAMVVGFAQMGMASADALAISVCLGLIQIAVGLPGGILWLIDRGRGRLPENA